MHVYGSVSPAALLHNLSIARQHAPTAQVMAVVKKDGYGHGLIRVAKILESKVDGFAVASVNEAVNLRESSVDKPITILSGFSSPDQIDLLAHHSLDPVIYCNEQFEMLESAKFDQLSIWIKFDTGMNRLGFSIEDFVKPIERAMSNSSIRIKGLMTHFACADDLNSQFTSQQINRFHRYSINSQHYVSLANSAGILRWPESRVGWIRPGIMLYGASPFPEIPAHQLDLKPVMNLYSRIISKKKLSAGASVGYGATWRCTDETHIGIVAAGYGDGFFRCASSKAKVLINNRKVNVIGRVSMDSLAIDLNQVPNAKGGTPVKLFGDGLPVEDLADAAGTIPYEIFTSLNPRTVTLTED